MGVRYLALERSVTRAYGVASAVSMATGRNTWVDRVTTKPAEDGSVRWWVTVSVNIKGVDTVVWQDRGRSKPTADRKAA
ncbi:MAG: hypothetical protein Q7W30_01440 [Coriobacteriia bacterium]|nr:hypothetical protein [Coriobacteriia bacterium]